jgi:hypothetical protein
MTRDDIIKAWNNQADKHNRWSDLGEDEMLEFAMRLQREACAKFCDKHWDDNGQHCANAIRAMGDK